MAKYQYRITTTSDWTSNFGYAFLALTNQSGSGRKLTLKSLEIQVANAFSTSGITLTGLYRATGLSSSVQCSGEDQYKRLAKHDTTNTLPSTVVLRRNATLPNISGGLIRQEDIIRRGAAVGTQNTLFTQNTIGKIGKQIRKTYSSSRRDRSAAAFEQYVINQNEAIGYLVSNRSTMTGNVRIDITFSVNDKSYNAQLHALAIPGMALFTLENTGTDVVKIISYGISELGTTDTPFIRMIPIGQIYAADENDLSKQNITITKMDTNYPDLSALKAYSDIGIVPSGVPEKYIADFSTGTPKGFNYLHTRDFDGPLYRTFLPEISNQGIPGGASGTLMYYHQQRFSDLLVRKSEITINPGEGIALVSSAETAVGVQAAYSGWPSLIFTAVIDSEPTIIPSITITNIPTGAEIRFRQGSYTLKYESNITIGNSVYTFDYIQDVPVEIVVTKAGYTIEPLSATLTLSNQVIALVYSPDPSYTP